jgi:hypothetical protein
MDFPRNNKALDDLFVKGQLPAVDVFNGDQYFVDILTGIPSARRLNHRKIFYAKADGFFGNNRVLGLFNFGYFQVGQAQDLALNIPVAVLDYSQPQTSFLFYNMRDHIVEIEKKSVYLGRYYMKSGDRLKFIGYFSLQNCKQK